MSNINISSESETDSEILNLINNYYDKCKHNMSKYISDKTKYDLEFVIDDNDKFIVNIYNKKKHVFKSYYEVLGCYNVTSSILTYSYATNIEKDLTYSTKKIKKYHKILKDSTKNVDLYLFYTGNASFFISYKNIVYLLNFCLYITEGKWIMSYKHETDNIIEFIIIKDIIKYINDV